MLFNILDCRLFRPSDFWDSKFWNAVSFAFTSDTESSITISSLLCGTQPWYLHPYWILRQSIYSVLRSYPACPSSLCHLQHVAVPLLPSCVFNYTTRETFARSLAIITSLLHSLTTECYSFSLISPITYRTLRIIRGSKLLVHPCRLITQVFPSSLKEELLNTFTLSP